MRFLFFLIVIGLAAPVAAEESCERDATVYNLDQVISEALSKNPSLKAGKERINQAFLVKRQAATGFLPKLATSYGYTRFGDDLSQNIHIQGMPGISQLRMQTGTQDNYQWKGKIIQPIFTGFAILSNYELAALGIDQAELEYRLTLLDLVLSVKEAYFNILKADKGVEVAQTAVESLESHVKTADNFYRVGVIPINDLLKAEVELGNSLHDLVKAKNSALLSRAVMNALLARPVDAAIDLVDIHNMKDTELDFKSCLKEALSNRPKIALVNLNIKQADERKRLVRSKLYPEVALNWEYTKEGDKAEVKGSPFHEANRWEVTIGASWTFWEWGKTYYQEKEIESSKSQLADNLQALKDKISLQVKQALLSVEEARKNIPISKKAIEQAEENLRVSQERYKAQVATSTDVLDAQALLTHARNNYYGALYDLHLAVARLERAIGRSD